MARHGVHDVYRRARPCSAGAEPLHVGDGHDSTTRRGGPPGGDRCCLTPPIASGGKQAGGDIVERLELERVAGRVQEEHRRLLTHLAAEANARSDAESHVPELRHGDHADPVFPATGTERPHVVIGRLGDLEFADAATIGRAILNRSSL